MRNATNKAKAKEATNKKRRGGGEEANVDERGGWSRMGLSTGIDSVRVSDKQG